MAGLYEGPCSLQPAQPIIPASGIIGCDIKGFIVLYFPGETMS